MTKTTIYFIALVNDPGSGLALEERIDRIRHFERFYEAYLRESNSKRALEHFAPGEVRVLHEMGLLTGGGGCGAWLSFRLDLDAGYLCRILRKLEGCDLVSSSRHGTDGRKVEWKLTRLGRRMAQDIEREYRRRARRQLEVLSTRQQLRLVEAMAAIEELLKTSARARSDRLGIDRF